MALDFHIIDDRMKLFVFDGCQLSGNFGGGGKTEILLVCCCCFRVMMEIIFMLDKDGMSILVRRWKLSCYT